jgi:hypothetical protein
VDEDDGVGRGHVSFRERVDRDELDAELLDALDDAVQVRLVATAGEHVSRPLHAALEQTPKCRRSPRSTNS